jgi:hypothetical protein
MKARAKVWSGHGIGRLPDYRSKTFLEALAACDMFMIVRGRASDV